MKITKSGRSYALGVVTSGISGGFYSSIFQGVEKECAKADYVVIPVFPTDATSGEKHTRNLIEYRVSGLVIFGDQLPADILAWTKHAQDVKIPFVLVDLVLGATFDLVYSDDYHGSIQATEHLIELGHRQIGILYGYSDRSTTQDRYRGFVDTLKRHQIPLHEDFCLRAKHNWPEGEVIEQTAKLLSSKNRPSALFVTTDGLACAVLKFALKKGLRIPEDLSIVGYGNTLISQTLAITSVHQNPELMGSTAVQHLLQRISNPSIPFVRTVIPTSLMVRDSTSLYGQKFAKK